MSEVIAGAKFEAPYPFVRATYAEDAPTWRPGVVYRMCAAADYSEAVAHGIGRVLLEVVDVHRPGRYPTRVFFVRRWQRPDGQTFGKTKLRMTTMQAFKRLAAGWRHGEFEVEQ